MSDTLRSIYQYLPLFWAAVYLALCVLAFARFRSTASGVILGTAFGIEALLGLGRYALRLWTSQYQSWDETLRAVYEFTAYYGIPLLLQICVIVGIALIPRSFRQLAGTSRGPAC